MFKTSLAFTSLLSLVVNIFVAGHGFLMAWHENVVLGIVTLFVEPMPLVIGWVDLLGHINLAVRIMEHLK